MEVSVGKLGSHKKKKMMTDDKRLEKFEVAPAWIDIVCGRRRKRVIFLEKKCVKSKEKKCEVERATNNEKKNRNIFLLEQQSFKRIFLF